MKPRILKLFSLLSAVIALVFVMLYMMGAFRTGVIQPGVVQAEDKGEISPEKVVTASREKISQWYEAVGTVRPRTEAHISSQANGRVLSVLVQSGDFVKKGDPLIRLDNRESKARLDQARQGVEAAKAQKESAEHALAAAQAVYTEAQSNYNRVKKYFDREAATRQDLERAEAAYHQARAGVEQARKGVAAATAQVERAKQGVEEVSVGLGYATVDAPESGQIAKRLVDPGDVAWPGKPLLVLQTPDSLRLDAYVREGLVRKVLPGSALRVVIDALNATVDGTVEEIVPSADPSSRTFLVKVAIPAVKGLLPGMFGRLFVPLEEREAVLIPKEAIRRIGQMEIVRAEENGQWMNLFIKTGKEVDGKMEVLSGLTGSERIAIQSEPGTD